MTSAEGLEGRAAPRRRRFRPAALVASPRFQAWAAWFPLTRPFVRREGAALFDLVAGFCHSQVLLALVQLGIPDRLSAGPQTTKALEAMTCVPGDRMEVLLRAAVAIGVLKRRGDTVRLTLRGAALVGVPGLQDMIRHHDVLYRDLSDPAAFFRGETETELADFWPYVFGAGAARDPEAAARYSRLMADSQELVAQDTLDAVSLRGVRRLMDVGGGTGAFLIAAGRRHADLQLDLVDLPSVVTAARSGFAQAGLADRLTFHGQSFRDEPLPLGADAISLVRVLYDHQDDTVQDLLVRVRAALPDGGRVVISEPMSGGDRPDRAGDGYFALYCMAMRTGRVRSAREISALLARAGFRDVRSLTPRRAYVTGIVTAVR